MLELLKLVSAAIILLAIVPGLYGTKTLKLVQVVMRHGDRTPTEFMPTDTDNAPDTWPQGVGEMTDLGLKQGYAVGQWLKNRYAGFVSTDYVQKEVYARADGGTNRTLMTTQVAMAGFYSPTPDPELLSWYPVPIHSVLVDQDPSLSELPRCPTAEAEYLKGELSPETRNFMLENKPFIDFLSNHSGINIVAALQIAQVYDPIDCEYRHLDTRKPPAWATPDVYRRLQQLGGDALSFIYRSTQFQRLRAGPLYKELADRISQKSQQDWETLSPDLKFVMFGTHDFNMVALLHALGAFNNIEIPFASVLLFELYETDGDYNVEIYYQNSTAIAIPTSDLPPPFPITIPGCPLQGGCPVKKILELAKPILPLDWEAECGLGTKVSKRSFVQQEISTTNSKWKNLSFAFIGLTVALSIVVIVMVVVVIKSRTNTNPQEQKLISNQQNGKTYETL